MSNVLKCPTEPLHGTTPQQKLKSKQAAHSFKHGSPKLRDLLREKCRIRVKEARSFSFQNSRNLEPRSLITKILREELAEMEHNINLQELIYEELIEEANEWFLEEFENMQNYLIDVSEASIIFCPICQKSGLQQSEEGSLHCDCGIRFGFNGSVQQFQKHLDKILLDHEMQCDHMLNFYLEPNEKKITSIGLNALCDKCDQIVCI